MGKTLAWEAFAVQLSVAWSKMRPLIYGATRTPKSCIRFNELLKPLRTWWPKTSSAPTTHTDNDGGSGDGSGEDDGSGGDPLSRATRRTGKYSG